MIRQSSPIKFFTNLLGLFQIYDDVKVTENSIHIEVTFSTVSFHRRSGDVPSNKGDFTEPIGAWPLNFHETVSGLPFPEITIKVQN